MSSIWIATNSIDKVSKQYASPGEFKGGIISYVKVSTGKEKYSDLKTEAARAWAKE